MHNEFFKQLETVAAGTQSPLDTVLAELTYNHEGLIPAIAQQYDTGEVLMLAWMNRQSIEQTLSTGQLCYWSRSRQTYWRKGESSGHTQSLIEMRIDCDGDTLLCLVDQLGAACHTMRPNCFFHQIDNKQQPPVIITGDKPK